MACCGCTARHGSRRHDRPRHRVAGSGARRGPRCRRPGTLFCHLRPMPWIEPRRHRHGADLYHPNLRAEPPRRRSFPTCSCGWRATTPLEFRPHASTVRTRQRRRSCHCAVHSSRTGSGRRIHRPNPLEPHTSHRRSHFLGPRSHYRLSTKPRQVQVEHLSPVIGRTLGRRPRNGEERPHSRRSGHAALIAATGSST